MNWKPEDGLHLPQETHVCKACGHSWMAEYDKDEKIECPYCKFDQSLPSPKVKTWEELEQIDATLTVGEKTIKYNMSDLNSILVGFWEGGISAHWVEQATVKHPTIPERPKGMPSVEWAFDALLAGGKLEVTNIDSDISDDMTLDSFKAGLVKFLTGREDLDNVVPNGVLDAGYIDAGMSDAIIQWALMDEVRYG